jgi:molybdate-binding protein
VDRRGGGNGEFGHAEVAGRVTKGTGDMGLGLGLMLLLFGLVFCWLRAAIERKLGLLYIRVVQECGIFLF